jgi:hypothetical protein
MNLGENQSSIYMMWELPNSSVTDNPPPYSENPSNRLVIEESENSRETTSKNINFYFVFQHIECIYFMLQVF